MVFIISSEKIKVVKGNLEGAKSAAIQPCSQLLAPTAQKNAWRYQNKGMPQPNMTSLLIRSQPATKIFSYPVCVCVHVCVTFNIISRSLACSSLHCTQSNFIWACSRLKTGQILDEEREEEEEVKLRRLLDIRRWLV